ncbi:TRAP transporter small permease [Nitratireductor alexandrii]|uniref:TRAP transporter small permease n=1 Tax=Nitratireductor alexandrii TaxID=2448161 RepID=UPI000FDB1B03|nr:TRAP transporter small permease [Nitratireductor alexandrii]
MKLLARLVPLLSLWLYWAGAICVILMVTHIGVDVIARLAFGRPTIGMVETVTNYYMIAACFLPLGYVQYRRNLLTVEAFTLSLPKRWLRILDIGALSVSAAISVALAWHSILKAIDQTQKGEYLDITAFDFPLWPARWMIVFGYGAVLLVLILQIILLISGRDLGEPEVVEA